MTRVHIPFKLQFKEAMISGRKTMTSRTHWWGAVGDEFVAFGECFTITGTFMLPLKDVARLYWQAEGCSSSDDFLRIWYELHPRMERNLGRLVYCHVFKVKGG